VAKRFLDAGVPVISVDAKKKENKLAVNAQRHGPRRKI
jgi:hypothetical protein